jgi:hypothetical protein
LASDQKPRQSRPSRYSHSALIEAQQITATISVEENIAMRTLCALSAALLRLPIALGLALSVAGCEGTRDPSPVATSASKSSADDPDVYRPASKDVPPPPSAAAKATSERAAVDPDTFTPAAPPQPTVSAANKHNPPPLSGKRPPATNPGVPTSDAFDPDAVSQEAVGPSRMHAATTGTDKSDELPVALENQLRLYQSETIDSVTRTTLEKQFCSDSREAILTLAFNQPATASGNKVERSESVVSQLWGRRFVDCLNLQLRALTTFAQRPSAVSLGAIIPNAAMRAGMRRTVARHWSEGPKAIQPASSAGHLAAEPGFIAVLKSIVRENKRPASSRSRAPTPTRANAKASSRDEPQEKSAEADWIAFLEHLVCDYCRQCHLASLSRAAAAVREGTAPSVESRGGLSLPPLPGCEAVTAHEFQWPGQKNSESAAGENDLIVGYQRFEKRTKASTATHFYRRQLPTCVERPILNGLWLDGLTELKGADCARSVDVLITWPKTRDGRPPSDEQELTVEVLCVAVRTAVE